MRISESLQSEMKYSRRLIGAVRAGQSSRALREELARSARGAWAPVVAGAAVGLLAAYFGGGTKKSGRGVVVGALAGGALGFGGAIAWSSRDTTSKLLRKASKNVSAVRDEHWLEKHPIAYA